VVEVSIGRIFGVSSLKPVIIEIMIVAGLELIERWTSIRLACRRV
jgi:hypothetical protein